MEKINIAEILKDCPSGMELDCTMYEGVKFMEVDTESNTIILLVGNKFIRRLNKYGQDDNVELAKCVIFPKGKTTWEGFVPPCKFKDGDIVVTKTSHNFIFYSIYKDVENGKVLTYVDYHIDSNRLLFNNDTLTSLCFIDEIVEQRLATEEEKQKLFDVIKENGYKWNAETKTLEKLIKPKFKVGDRIVKKGSACVPLIITGVSDDCYYSNTENSVGVLSVADQDDWELVKDNINPKFKVGDRIKKKGVDDVYALEIAAVTPTIYTLKNCDGFLYVESTDKEYELVPNKFDINTLKPFDKVLVRHNKDNKWCGSLISHIDSNYHSYCYKYVTVAGKSYPMCIPYEGNERLRGTTDDCDEFYKTW